MHSEVKVGLADEDVGESMDTSSYTAVQVAETTINRLIRHTSVRLCD